MDFPPQFMNPLLLILISPVVLGGLYAIRRGVSKYLILSRIIILCLLIIALASPFTMGTTTVRDDAPRITVLSDQTMSMDLFTKDTGQKLYEAIKSKTPTTFRKFSGMSSPIGDEVISASENNNIVLISDGNANYGKDLTDAISFVNKSGTRVFAIKQNLLHNDLSVEIVGAKNLIIGNENVFNIVVRQTGDSARYTLEVNIDDKPVSLPDVSKNVIQTEKIKTIKVSYIFTKLGTHRVEAVIKPMSGDDWFPTNNKFFKAVFVVPKPNMLAITDDSGSSLYQIIDSLYAVDRAGSIPDDLSKYRVVIIDNMGAGMLGTDSLKNYVAGGGGLVVVGGDASYDKGKYNNSPVEAILPIISRAAEYKGGRNIVIAIDYSLSSTIGDSGTGISFMSLISANAIKIIREISRDSNVAVLAFGEDETNQTGLISMSSQTNRANLEQFVKDLTLQAGYKTTALDIGLISSEKILDTATGTKEIIVISDGLMKSFQMDKIRKALSDLKGKDIKIYFVQVLMSYQNIKTPDSLYNELAQATGGQVIVLNPDERATVILKQDEKETPNSEIAPEIINQFPLVALDNNHFITQYINITASVTGYNDVTPKLGADRLVATTKGKPIITTWGFGMGRVAAFTTDDGSPSSDPTRPWASAVYNGENARLISGMINWAIGDPRGKEGVVVQAEDIWGGTPGKVIVKSDTLPQLNLDKTPLVLSKTGETTYESTINLDNPEPGDFHDISGYGIAVNYPLEYREIGFNEKLVQVIESNGGSVYNEDDVQGLLFMDIKEKAVRTVNEPKSEKEPYLLAALVLFLTEVIIRRLKDYRKDRPVIEENPVRTAQVAE